MDTEGFTAWAISVMLLRGKKDQFIIKTAWLVLQPTSVCEDSKCGRYTPDSGLLDTDVNHARLPWMRKEHPLLYSQLTISWGTSL